MPMRAALLNPFFAAFADPNKWTLPRSVPVDYFRTTGQLSVQWNMLRPLVSLAPRRTKRKRLAEETRGLHTSEEHVLPGEGVQL